MRRFLFLMLIFFSTHVSSQTVSFGNDQTTHGDKASFSTSQGTWFFSSPEKGIIKAVFEFAKNDRGELISNAVILKPAYLNIQFLTHPDSEIVFDDASIIIHGKNIRIHFSKSDAEITSVFSDSTYKGFRFSLNNDEQIYGGGERAVPMNRRGYHFDLYNKPNYGYGAGAQNLNFSVPLFYSSRGYAIFFDNPSKGYIDIGKADANTLEAGFVSGELNCYIIEGKNIDEILHRYTDLTGMQDIPARWVFGAIMSRFGYRSELQARNVIDSMKLEKFPMDAIVFDLFWFGDSIKGTLGNLQWMNEQRWPNPQQMISDFRKDGIKTILITEPYILQSTPNYTPTLSLQATDSAGNPYVLKNFYFGKGGLLDLFRKDAQNFFWNKYQLQIDKGVAGWWGDLGEPETHPANVYHHLNDLGFSRPFSADEVHNLFGQYWSKMLSDNYASAYPDVRLFHLNRSGFAGSQRYHAFPWTGDVGRNWSGLQAQLPVLLGMSICGIPYVHSDAGGFAGGVKDPELYTRWLQFAVFTPVFRPHGTALGNLDPKAKNIESEPIYYPEPYKSIVRNYFNLRYELMPYNYTLAYEQQKDGKPLMRPMFYSSSADTNLLRAGDQYYWGDEMIVAPVLESGATQRKVYLPSGSWYSWDDEKKISGMQWITQNVTINSIPIFVKAGSFIPEADSLMNMDQYDNAKFSVYYYYDQASSSYTMYEDDGKTNDAYQKGQYDLLTFVSSGKKTKQEIRLKDSGGNFPGKPSSRTINFVMHQLPSKPKKIRVNDNSFEITEAPAREKNAQWNDQQRTLTLHLTFKGEEEIRLKY